MLRATLNTSQINVSRKTAGAATWERGRRIFATSEPPDEKSDGIVDLQSTIKVHIARGETRRRFIWTPKEVTE